MMGSLLLLLLNSFNIAISFFNEQYSYFYMLMARRNLDQPLGDSKNTLIKFNEQIASKYRSGLSLRFLDSYAQKNVVPNSIKQFYIQNQVKQVSRIDFENILKSNTDKRY
jgi:phosphoglycerate-specific signal transduction histidine kinase